MNQDSTNGQNKPKRKRKRTEPKVVYKWALEMEKEQLEKENNSSTFAKHTSDIQDERVE